MGHAFVDATGREISPADAVSVDARWGMPTTRSSKVTDTEMEPEMIQQVLATDEARRMAMLHGDVSALDSYLADEAMIFWGDGTVDDKTSTLALLRSGRLRYSQLDYDSTRVRLYGQTAVVTGQARIREQIEGQNVAHTAYVTRIYVRQGDRWRLVGSQTTKIAPGSQLGSTSTEEARIRQASEDWGHAALSGDLERTVSFYAEDASYLPPGAPIIVGKDAIRKAWTNFLAIPGISLKTTTRKIDVASSGDLAYEIGAWDMTRNDNQGKPVNSKGKYVVVWKKELSGDWKAVLDMENSDQ